MVTFLKGRRRTDSDAEVLVEGAKGSTALEALIARAEVAAQQLRALEPVMERSAELDTLRERCEAAEQRLAGLENLAAQLASSEEQAERVAKTQARTETQLAHATEDVDRLRTQLGGLGDRMDTALLLREQLESFLSLESPMAALRNEADSLRTQLAELTENVARMRGQHDDALTAHRHTTSRLEAFDQEHQAATGRLEEVVRKVQSVERTLEPLNQATTAIPDIQHQLAVLKALADQVGQKTGAIEQQREAVERAANQISQLTRLDRELDAWLRRQEEQIRRFGGIEAKMAEIQGVQVKVLARNEELQAASRQAEEAQQAARQALIELREQMRKSSEGFELENRGLHAVSERVADLRNAVKECEARFGVLDAASQGTAAVQAQVRALADQAGELAQELVRLSDEARRIGTIREDAERLDALAGEVGERMHRIERLKPEVDQVLADLGTLKGTREVMADGLEQMRLAYEEMTRLRESHSEVQTWLANADAWTRKVQAQVADLGGMEPAVERIRFEVDQVRSTMEQIQSRRELIEEVNRGLIELGSMSAELKDRTDGLRAQMEGAEGRFTKLAKQAEAAHKVSEVIAGVSNSVTEADRRIVAVDESVRALENRTQQLDEVEERVRQLGQELEQRQGALDKATEHLTQASALRQGAAEAAQRLEEISRAIGTALAQAEDRSGTLVRISGDLDARATALKPIEKQLAHFEELLGRWESAQGEAARALEQTLARQAAVEALEAQVKHVFGMAERAVEHVQTIGSARREIEETRNLLEETQVQFKAAEEGLQGLATRQRQLDRAEQRLARAEALALGIRSTVESLQAQRTVVDHALESAGALTLQMKQAEAVISTLRRERTLACDLSAAMETMRAEDDEIEPRKGRDAS
jgi:chromosome segregation ATPase